MRVFRRPGDRAGADLSQDKYRRLAAAIVCTVLAFPISALAEEEPRVFGAPNVWQWAPSRLYHIDNYKLTLHFDEEKEEVFGNEVIALQPLQRQFRTFYLDSNELSIDSVSLEGTNNTPVALAFRTDDRHLWITLDRDYDTAPTLRINIKYHGFPRTGLFFVNPNPSYPQWPREVFTQGETEFNQYWFPCWDYPNDMATSEIIATVPEGQVVVSNGKLVREIHSDGKATYDWVESIPHSSYLVSLAIGPWRRFTDMYEDKPVDYYAPQTVDEATVRRSFHLTPDMIGFFSRATGVNYPYEKYDQVVVQNYMFGGQENVTATTLTDSTLHDQRADLDYPSTDLVSHELGQHWFGDYVQARDWADIWLNEGFATYLEALYTQYHEGNDAYRLAVYMDQLAEQKEDRGSYRRPLVDRHYIDAMDMIDATTHEKGADVLDMLRYVMDGPNAASHPASQEEMLFRALHEYLRSNHAQSVDTPRLIEVIREATGMELGWFFHQWVFMAGHPEYRVQTSYDATQKTEKVVVAQTQQTRLGTPIFEMPIELVFYGKNGENNKIQVHDYLQEQEFDIPLDFEPQWVDFDPDDFIDKTVQFDKPVAALIAEAEKDPSMMSRLWAVQQLGLINTVDPDERVDALSRVLSKDAFYAVRAAAATSLGKIRTKKALTTLLSALQQSDSRVRRPVVEALAGSSDEWLVYRALVRALHHDSSYAVEAAAAAALARSSRPEVFDELHAEIQTEPEVHVMQALLSGLATTKDPRAAAILLSRAHPGMPERVRVSALDAIGRMEGLLEVAHGAELVAVVRAALSDPFYPVQEAGEQLVGIYHLQQFELEIERRAANSPMAMQRAEATRVLKLLEAR